MDYAVLWLSSLGRDTSGRRMTCERERAWIQQVIEKVPPEQQDSGYSEKHHRGGGHT